MGDAAAAVPCSADYLPDERLWKVSDVARYLGVHVNWVYLHAGREVPCIRIGGLLRFDPAAVKAATTKPVEARVLSLPVKPR